jgi:hypothetical protein
MAGELHTQRAGAGLARAGHCSYRARHAVESMRSCMAIPTLCREVIVHVQLALALLSYGPSMPGSKRRWVASEAVAPYAAPCNILARIVTPKLVHL